jgi:hypothetical protein
MAGYAALVIIAAALGVVAYRSIFGSFLPFDDEGYMLVSLRGFFDGGALYDQVSSQYGPGYFVLVGGPLHLFGFAFSSDAARMVNLFASVTTTFLISLFLLRRSVLVAVPSIVVGFLVLRTSFDQPLHPGMVIVLLLAGLIITVAFAIRRRASVGMAAAGALLAAVASIDITVGLLAIAAFAFTCVMTVPELRRFAALRLSVCGLYVAIPWLLLSGNLDQGWALRCALIVSIGGLALALVSGRCITAPLPKLGNLRWLAAGAAPILVVVIAVVLIGGTGLGGLLHGWVIDPISDMASQAPALQSHWGAVVWALAGLAVAVLVRSRLDQDRIGGNSLTGALRMAVGLLIWVCLASDGDVPIIGPTAVSVAVPFAWMVALLPSTAVPDTRFVRTLVASLAVLVSLHAYPAAGSQEGWSELLLVLVGGICLLDGFEELSLKSVLRWRGLPVMRLAAALPLAVFAAWVVIGPLRDAYSTDRDSYRSGKSLALPGAEKLRLPATQTETLRRLSADLRRRCDTFLTIPGMYSLNLFAAEDPPTERNLPTWMWDLDTDQQRKVVEQVSGIRSLCVVRNRSLIGFWKRFEGSVPSRPLLEFVRRDFRAAKDFDGYQLMTRVRSPALAPADGGEG